MNLLTAASFAKYTLAFKRVNIKATISKTKTLFRNYSIKKRGVPTEQVSDADQQILSTRVPFSIPKEGIPVFAVRSVRMYKIVAYAAVAQLASAAVLAPILMKSETGVATQTTKNTLAVVLLSWGVGVMLISRHFVTKNILSLALTPGPTLQYETINVLGRQTFQQVPLTSIEKVMSLDVARQAQFVRVKINDRMYFMDKQGDIHDEDLFEELVVDKDAVSEGQEESQP